MIKREVLISQIKFLDMSMVMECFIVIKGNCSVDVGLKIWGDGLKMLQRGRKVKSPSIIFFFFNWTTFEVLRDKEALLLT